MRSNRRPESPIAFRSHTATAATTNVAASHFPQAVAGEDYDRYLKAVWRQGERWFARSSHRVARISISIHEAREILVTAAEREAARPLHPQEQRLLGELVQKGWPTLERWPDEVEPEIPAFLLASGSVA